MEDLQTNNAFLVDGSLEALKKQCRSRPPQDALFVERPLVGSSRIKEEIKKQSAADTAWIRSKLGC